jgi:hypothetical protein
MPFGDSVALVKSVESRLERGKSNQLHDLSESVEIGDRFLNRLSVLADFVEAVGEKQRVTRS